MRERKKKKKRKNERQKYVDREIDGKKRKYNNVKEEGETKCKKKKNRDIVR